MECPVCYESDSTNGDLLWLQCLHPLCRQCLRRLERKVCPLCRSDIGDEISPDRQIKRSYSDSDVPTIRVRARHRRRRRAVIDILNIDDPSVSVIVESFENVSLRGANKSKRNPNRKERSGKWANRNRQTYGGRKCWVK